MLPLSIGLAAVAPTVVDTFFDPRWSNVGAMLMCLSAVSVARPVRNILIGYFYATGRPSARTSARVGESDRHRRRDFDGRSRRHQLGVCER